LFFSTHRWCIPPDFTVSWWVESARPKTRLVHHARATVTNIFYHIPCHMSVPHFHLYLIHSLFWFSGLVAKTLHSFISTLPFLSCYYSDHFCSI
jgi:hypothetical protein